MSSIKYSKDDLIRDIKGDLIFYRSMLKEAASNETYNYANGQVKGLQSSLDRVKALGK